MDIDNIKFCIVILSQYPAKVMIGSSYRVENERTLFSERFTDIYYQKDSTKSLDLQRTII